MIRGIVVVDATVETDHWEPDRHARAVVDELNRTAPRGSRVRLHVGSVHAPWPASLYDDRPRVDPIWAEFVERFDVEITGTHTAVREWTESLNRCVNTTSPTAGV